MIHLYAFVQGMRGFPDVAGVAGEPLEMRPISDITAVVGTVGREVDDAESAIRHGLAVESLLARAAAVLPVHMGRPFRDERSLRDAVEEKLPRLRTSLLTVVGCVEVGVRVAGGERPEPPPAADGTGYMQARLRRLAEREATVEEIHERLRTQARDSVVSHGRDTRFLHDAGYLVERAEVRPFGDLVGELAAAHPELTIVCTGPWAPYSFAGAA